jgi:hypothetical protein
MMVLAAAAALATTPPATTNMAASSVSNSGAQVSSSTPAAKGQSATAEKLYCTSGTISGSRIVKRECKTKEQWAKAGVSLDDLMNPDQQ